MCVCVCVCIQTGGVAEEDDDEEEEEGDDERMGESAVGLCDEAVGERWWKRGPMVLVTDDARRFSVGVAMRASVGFAGLEDSFDVICRVG